MNSPYLLGKKYTNKCELFIPKSTLSMLVTIFGIATYINLFSAVFKFEDMNSHTPYCKQIFSSIHQHYHRYKNKHKKIRLKPDFLFAI